MMMVGAFGEPPSDDEPPSDKTEKLCSASVGVGGFGEVIG